MRSTIPTFVAEEMYDGFIIPQAKKYRTILAELTTYLLLEQILWDASRN